MNLIHAAKTGLAAAITAVIYLAFNIPHGFWAVVSAVVVMQANIGSSLKASWARLLGTAMGALIGASLAASFNALWPGLLAHGEGLGLGQASLMALATGAGVALTGALCIVLRLKDAYRLAGVTCAIVLLVFAQHPWESALQRTLDVALGIFVALVVTVFVWPSRARQQLSSKLAEVLRDIAALCAALEHAYQNRCYLPQELGAMRDAMKQKFRDSRALLQEADNEPGRTAAEAAALGELFVGVERLLEHVLSLDEAARSSDAEPGDPREEPRDDELHRKIAGEIKELTALVKAGCEALAHALIKRGQLPELAGMDEAVGRLDARLLELRTSGISRRQPLDEVMRFHMFVQALKALSRDLVVAAGKLRARAGRDLDPAQVTRRVKG